jgi:hypothetical protein
MSWTFKERKGYTKYGTKYPPSVEARNTFNGRVGEREDGHPTWGGDVANVLIVAYADGTTTVSMNGTAHMTEQDARDLAFTIRCATIAAERLTDPSQPDIVV